RPRNRRRLSRSVDRILGDGSRWLNGLAAHQHIEPGDVRPPRDRDRRHVGAAMMKRKKVASPAEEPQDVFGAVLETVRRIVAAVHDAAMTAPIRLDEPSKELLGVAADDLTLPVLEFDASSMLPTRTMP